MSTDEPEERMRSARNCLEKYIMNKIADVAFKAVEVPEEDEALLRKMKCLSFVPASVTYCCICVSLPYYLLGT